MTSHPDNEARAEQRKKVFYGGFDAQVYEDEIDKLMVPKGLKPCKSFEKDGVYCEDCGEQRGLDPESFPKLFLNWEHMASC